MNENVGFTDNASGHALAMNWKNDNDVTIFQHNAIVSFFKVASLVKFSYLSKFHVNIITGSRNMTIFLYKGLTRNPEIRNNSSEFWDLSGKWGKLGIPNLTRTCLKCCWILQNARVTAFTVSELFRENQQNGESLKLPRSVPKLGLSRIFSHGTESRIFKNFKDMFSGLRHFLAAESSLKMMKNAFYFTSEALFFFNIFNFMSWLFGQVAKRLHKKDKVNSKSYDVTAWLTNSCNTHIALYLKK